MYTRSHKPTFGLPRVLRWTVGLIFHSFTQCLFGCGRHKLLAHDGLNLLFILPGILATLSCHLSNRQARLVVQSEDILVDKWRLCSPGPHTQFGVCVVIWKVHSDGLYRYITFKDDRLHILKSEIVMISSLTFSVRKPQCHNCSVQCAEIMPIRATSDSTSVIT